MKTQQKRTSEGHYSVERLLPINALADLAGVSRATAWRYVEAAGLRRYRVPGDRRTCVDLVELAIVLLARQLGRRSSTKVA